MKTLRQLNPSQVELGQFKVGGQLLAVRDTPGGLLAIHDVTKGTSGERVGWVRGRDGETPQLTTRGLSKGISKHDAQLIVRRSVELYRANSTEQPAQASGGCGLPRLLRQTHPPPQTSTIGGGDK